MLFDKLVNSICTVRETPSDIDSPLNAKTSELAARGHTGASKSRAAAFAHPLPRATSLIARRVALRPIRKRTPRAATATAAAVFWLFLLV
jgi:hypothetical protein